MLFRSSSDVGESVGKGRIEEDYRLTAILEDEDNANRIEAVCSLESVDVLQSGAVLHCQPVIRALPNGANRTFAVPSSESRD